MKQLLKKIKKTGATQQYNLAKKEFIDSYSLMFDINELGMSESEFNDFLNASWKQYSQEKGIRKV
jgi:hypothetical protein